MSPADRILVIKHSALGDFILSIAAMQAIRRHHPGAHMTLLTTAPFVELARTTGLFDEVWSDPRARLYRPAGLLALIRRLRRARFDRVYDLQRSERTAFYFRLLKPSPPEWVGPAPGASHRYPGKAGHRHILEREAEQLTHAGITDIGPPDLSFLAADVSRFELPSRTALLVPGASPRHPAKRWPASGYGALACRLVERGLTPVLLGTDAEGDVLAEVARACPAARDLKGQTNLADLAELGRRAELAVGNDTGPMHLLAAVGCPALVLFGPATNPVRNAPRGHRVRTIQRPDLGALAVEEVLAALPLS